MLWRRFIAKYEIRLALDRQDKFDQRSMCAMRDDIMRVEASRDGYMATAGALRHGWVV
jgi:hypothetical protein